MRSISKAVHIILFCLLLSSSMFSQKNMVGFDSSEDQRLKNDGIGELLESAPLGTLEVITLRSPSFGSFYCGNGGGKIIVNEDGTRTAEGDVILLTSQGSVAPALFEIRCEPYMMLQLFKNAYFSLEGENGQVLISKIISTNPSFPLATPANAKQGFTVALSVCLEIEPGHIAAPGNYNGNFQLNWIIE